MEYHSTNAAKSKSTAAEPKQLRSVRRNTMMLQQHKEVRHNAAVDRLQKLKEEKKRREEEAQQHTFAPTIPSRMVDPRKAHSSTASLSSATKNNGATPSKLLNRFMKKEPKGLGDSVDRDLAGGKSKTTPNNNPNTSTEVDSGQVESKELGNAEWTLHQDELFNVKAERDELLMEKSFWLSKFQADNASLLQILMSTRDVKVKMLQEIDSLEKEKDRLRSLQLDGLESSLLDRVMDNSPLAEANRTTLPAHLRGRADELHKTLNTLATKCRSNQLAVFEMFVAKVEETENEFLNRNDDAVDNIVAELKNIASSSPGNVMAAVAVSQKFPEMMLAALIEKRDDAIRDESLRAHGNAEQGETGEAKEVKVADDVTRTLMAQNNTLRASVTQLRKKNAELKLKLSLSEEAASEAAVVLEHHSQSLAMEEAKSQQEGGSGTHGTAAGGVGKKQRRGSLMASGAGVGAAAGTLNSPPMQREKNNTATSSTNRSSSSNSSGVTSETHHNNGEHVRFEDNTPPTNPLPPSGSSMHSYKSQANQSQSQFQRFGSTPSPLLSHNDVTNSSPRKRASVQGSGPGRKSVISASHMDNTFDALPGFVKDQAWGPIVAGISEITTANPLAATLSRSVLQGVQKEVAYQARELVASALWLLGGRDRWESVVGTVDGKPCMEYKEQIYQTVNRCLHTPQVYAELVSVTMLALTYTHSRSVNIRHKSPQPQQQQLKQKQQQQQPHGKDYESEEDDDEVDTVEYREERDTFDDQQFGDSSVLFQSPSHSHFSGRVQHHQQQFTLNPNDRGNSSGRYMAS